MSTDSQASAADYDARLLAIMKALGLTVEGRWVASMTEWEPTPAMLAEVRAIVNAPPSRVPEYRVIGQQVGRRFPGDPRCRPQLFSTWRNEADAQLAVARLTQTNEPYWKFWIANAPE